MSSSVDKSIATLDEAMRQIDLLTKQRDSARNKVADLYIERDQAWAALLEYHETMKALLKEEQAGDADLPLWERLSEDVERLSSRHKAPLGAARVEMMGKEE